MAKITYEQEQGQIGDENTCIFKIVYSGIFSLSQSFLSCLIFGCFFVRAKKGGLLLLAYVLLSYLILN